jgi:hypothetical protein
MTRIKYGYAAVCTACAEKCIMLFNDFFPAKCPCGGEFRDLNAKEVKKINDELDSKFESRRQAVMQKCTVCNIEFPVTRRRREYCSPGCKSAKRAVADVNRYAKNYSGEGG